MTSEVDRGEIISQQKIMLNDTITAYEVVREGMRVGTELFKTFIPELLTKRIDGKKIVTEEFVYLNRALPQNGMLDTSKNITDIYRLLRSFDYGRTDTLKPLKVLWKGNSYFVRSYSLTGNAEESAGRRTDLHDKILTVCENGKKLTINLQDGHA